MAIVLEKVDAGETFDEAKIISDREMADSVNLFIDTILGMYDKLSSRTLDLMREKVERKRIEEALKLAHEELEIKIEERTAELRQEIEERKNAELELSKLYQAIEQSPISFVITDLEGSIEYVNPHFCEISGFTHKEAINEVQSFVRTALQNEDKYSELWNRLSNGLIWRGELQSKNKYGKIYWEKVTLAPIKDDNGTTIKYLGLREDLSIQKEYEERLFKEANYNALTGLPNRFQALNSIKIDVEKEISFAVVFIDLSGMKNINNSLGVDAGDQLIINVASQLKSLVNETQNLYHIGGGKFLFLISPSTGLGTESLISRVLGNFKNPIFIEDHKIFQRCSIGIALHPNDGCDAQELLNNAQTASSKSKLKSSSYREQAFGIGRWEI